MRSAVVIVLLVACGRINLDPIENLAGDATGDATSDGPRVCPADTAALSAGVTTCIEKAERGTETWTDADATCRGLGRRLCTDAEWALACDQATGLVDMFNDEAGVTPNWEWVADLVGGSEAAKRGFSLCTDTSSHEIFVDPYDYRCCVDI